MKLEQITPIAAPSEKVSAFLEDIPAVVRCLPYVEDVREIGPDLYEGRARLKVGFVRLESTGQVRVVRGPDGAWRLAGEGRGHSIGHGEVEARVKADSGTLSTLEIEAEVHLRGVLGALGEAVMRRKAEAILAEFGANIRRAIEGG
jgi:carbon monoxide dehydrogenase subunit G